MSSRIGPFRPNRLCCRVFLLANETRRVFKLDGQFSKLSKGAESRRESALADHLRDFDFSNGCCSKTESFEPQHWSSSPFDEPVVLSTMLF